MTVEKIPDSFEGKGEVKGILFERFHESENCYVYFRSDGNYEVFKKKTTPLCIDFENKIYSQDRVKEVYPKSKDFGKCAWTCKSSASALIKTKELSISNQTNN